MANSTPSPQGGQAPHSNESSTEEARSVANNIFIKSVTSRIRNDPSVDLSQFLQQQATSYPQLCNSLSRRKGSESSSSETGTHGEAHTPASAAEASQFQLTADFIVIHPLDETILALASARQSDLEAETTHAEFIASAINRAIDDSQTLWRLHNTIVLQISSSQVVKIGTLLDHDGITNLQFIGKYAPEVPVPSCLGALQCGQRTYAFMTRADGETLEAVWPRLQPHHKRSIQHQLSTIFQQLRKRTSSSAQARPQGIGSFESGRCKDMRRNLREAEAPIQDETQFNDFLCRQPRRTDTPWIKMVRSFMEDTHELVMTHGDLHPRNIMVQWGSSMNSSNENPLSSETDICVTALIDWELAGWYPAYWEFVKALSTVQPRGPLADWCNYLPTEAIGNWPRELAMDILIDRWLG